MAAFSMMVFELWVHKHTHFLMTLTCLAPSDRGRSEQPEVLMENDGTWREKQRNRERRVTLLYVVKQGAPPSKLLFCLIFCSCATLSATLRQH